MIGQDAPAVHALQAFSVALRLLRPYWPVVLLATGCGALAGAANAALIGLVNRSLGPGAAGAGFYLAFLGLLVAAVAAELAGNIGNSVIGQRVVAGLRRDLCDLILTASLPALERVKAARLIAALDRDVGTISAFTFSIASTAVAASILIGCFVYLAVLSPSLALVAALAACLDATVQVLAGRRASAAFDVARSGYDDLQKQYGVIIAAAKDLRVDRTRRLSVRNGALHGAIDRIKERFTRATTLYFSAKAANSAIFFATLLIVIASGTALGMTGATLSGFVLVLIFIRGPTDQIVSSAPLIAEAVVSLRRIAALTGDLCGDEEGLLDGGPPPAIAPAPITLSGLVHTFPADDGEGFTVGPIDLVIQPGEVLFISGANGSGKTTLIKLLLGLLPPSAGALRYGDRPVTAATRDAYRQAFSVIFFDYFLFDQVIGAPDAAVRPWLRRLEIDHKVRFADGMFGGTDALSTGQRKRLALIHVLLSDRPVVVLDEWAADQDPVFRAVFYHELIPALRQQGKTLVVVSHDDRYFAAADRVLTLSDGRIFGG